MAQDQRVDWLFAAQVTGQNELQRLTLAVGKMREEIDALKTANGGLAIGMANVSRSMGNASAHVQAYRKHLDEQAKAMRNTRQGTQQLGMQINDFATSVATGASPVQAFNQQLGQVGYALSMMEGRAGAVGAFLAGPWGAAITIAAMVIGPMITNLLDWKTAAENARKAAADLADQEAENRQITLDIIAARFNLGTATKENIKEYKLLQVAAMASAQADMASASAALEASLVRMTAAKNEAKAMQFLKDTGPFGKISAAVGGFLGFGDVDGAIKNVEEDTKKLRKKIEQSWQSINRVRNAGSNLKPDKAPKGEKPKVFSEADKLRMAQEAIIAAYERGDLTLGEFETKLVSVTEAFKDARKPAEDWLNQFKEANKDVEKFKDFTEKLTSKSVPEYVATLRDLERQYESLQKNDKMTGELQIGFAKAIKATATGPIDELIKKYEEMHTGTTEFQQDLIAAKTVMDNLSKETGEASGIGFQAAADAYGRLNKAIADAQVRERNQEIVDSFKSIGMSVSDAFKGMITGATSWKDAMKGIIASVIDELWKLFVVQQIVGFVSKAIGGVINPAGAAGGSTVGTDWTAGMRSLNLPTPKAIGGSVGKNRPYMVGERGPELFIPGGSGTIIPNRNLGANGGGNPINISVDARGASDPAAVRAQVQQGILEAAPAIIAAAEARTVNGLRRPRLGGVMQ